MTNKTNYFLDTTVFRSFFLSSNVYKKYIKTNITINSSFFSKFVLMEFTRSYVANLINFYFLLDNPEILSLGDAISIWSNKYKTSELKAILQLIGKLPQIYEIDNKESAKKAIESYVRLILVKAKTTFKDAGTDSTRCSRALVNLSLTSDNFSDAMRQFKIEFDSTDYHQNKCRVYSFLFIKHRTDITSFINGAAASSCSQAFKNVALSLSIIANEGLSKCTCRMCGNVGDAIICLDCPQSMILVHSDNSFDDMCAMTKQPHNKLHSEIAHLKSSSSAATPQPS